MAISIGPGGHTQLLSAAEGPKRGAIRVISFVGRSDTGAISNPMFITAQNLAAVIDVTDGSVRTTEFAELLENGVISQTDTGPSGHTCFAIVSDTGV